MVCCSGEKSDIWWTCVSNVNEKMTLVYSTMHQNIAGAEMWCQSGVLHWCRDVNLVYSAGAEMWMCTPLVHRQKPQRLVSGAVQPALLQCEPAPSSSTSSWSSLSSLIMIIDQHKIWNLSILWMPILWKSTTTTPSEIYYGLKLFSFLSSARTCRVPPSPYPPRRKVGTINKTIAFPHCCCCRSFLQCIPIIFHAPKIYVTDCPCFMDHAFVLFTVCVQMSP